MNDINIRAFRSLQAQHNESKSCSQQDETSKQHQFCGDAGGFDVRGFSGAGERDRRGVHWVAVDDRRSFRLVGDPGGALRVGAALVRELRDDRVRRLDAGGMVPGTFCACLPGRG